MEEFINICNENMNIIRKVKIENMIENNNSTCPYESVFIEFRIMPHAEFIIRNTILKLGSQWCHTIVCGNKNYESMKEICDNISPNIKIIKLDYDNLDTDQYNRLLLSIFFWKLLNGDKILIYQSDSIIFKNNIDDFTKFDYIGAPWKVINGMTYIGNGGFSLRNRMIIMKILNDPRIYNEQRYINTPEDVFFSNAFLMLNSFVSDYNTASQFSTENIVNYDSFGGHQFWNYDKNWKNRMYFLIQEIEKSI